MPSLLDIRRRIKSVKNTQKITKAIQMVAASRLRRASEMAMAARPYVVGLERVHQSVTSRMAEVSDPLYQASQGKSLLIVVSADKGLCGSFNANVLKATVRMIRKNGIENTAVLPIGKKAVSFFKRSECQILKGYTDLFRNLNAATAEPLADQITRLYREGGWQDITIVFNSFKNIMVQEVTTTKLLPLSAEHSDEPEMGVEHITEPDLETIIAEMAPKLIVTKVFQALMESNAAEQAAKMTAMDAATNNASEMIDKLTLEMNKARQAAITKELIEIVSGAAAL